MAAKSILYRAGILASVAAAAAALIACATVPTPQGSETPVAATWQHHQITIDYYGLTALYSCDGFEDRVRAILLYLGARSDLKVQMDGCNRAFDRPGHMSSARAVFYTLAPVSGTSTTPVAAQWKRLAVRPMVPYGMGLGECELVRQLQPVVAADFSTRNLDYHTACVPYDMTTSDYSLSGEFLALPASRAQHKSL